MHSMHSLKYADRENDACNPHEEREKSCRPSDPEKSLKPSINRKPGSTVKNLLAKFFFLRRLLLVLVSVGCTNHKISS